MSYLLLDILDGDIALRMVPETFSIVKLISFIKKLVGFSSKAELKRTKIDQWLIGIDDKK